MESRPRRHLLLFVLLILAVAACRIDVEHPATADSSLPEAEIDALVEAEIGAGRAAGIAVGVSRGGEIAFARGYGMADLENDVAVTPQTVFRIGSITKQFTAAAIMKLVEEGRLSLDEPLNRVLPDFPTQGHTVTIEQLLNHTSGIKSYTGQPAFRDKMRLDLSHEDLLALVTDLPFDFDPGEQFRYNNSGYFLLGMVIEKVTGESYADHLDATLFQPLGLTSTTYCGETKLVPHRAEGYELRDDQLVNDDWLSMDLPYAAGSLCSTVGDLLAWQHALANGEVVSAESYARMSTPGTLNDGEALKYGFGLGAVELEGHRVIRHGGGINGFVSMLAAYPDDDVAVAVLVNTGGPLADRVAEKVALLSLGLELPVIADLPVSEVDSAGIVGVFDLGPMKMTVSWREDRIFLQAEGQDETRLRHQGEYVFVPDFDDRVRVQFEFVDGRATELILFQGGERRAPRVE